MRYVKFYVVGVECGFAGIGIHHEGERRAWVADDTGSHYSVGAAFVKIYVERSQRIRSGRAVFAGNAQRDVAVGGHVNKRRGRAEGEVVEQQRISGVHVHGRVGAVVNHLEACRRGQRQFEHRAVGQGSKQTESRRSAQKSTGKHICSATGQTTQVGAERSHHSWVSGCAHGEIVLGRRQAEVGGKFAVGQIRDSVVGYKNGVHIHCRSVGRTMQHGDIHVAGIGGSLAAGIIDDQRKRRIGVAHHAGSGHDVGFSCFQIYIKRGDHIGDRCAVFQSYTQRDVAVGRHVNERRGRAEGEIIEQQGVACVHIYSRFGAVVDHLHAGSRGQRQFEHRAVGQGCEQTEGGRAAQQTTGKHVCSAAFQAAEIGAEGSHHIRVAGSTYGKVVFGRGQTEVSGIFAVSQIGNHVVGHKHRVHIHRRSVGGTVQYGDVHIVRIACRLAAGIVYQQGKRRVRIAHDARSGHDVGFSIVQVHVKRSNRRSGGSTGIGSNAERNVHAGRHKNERGSGAVFKIVEQEVGIGVHVHGRRGAVVDHLHAGYRGSGQFHHRAVGQGGEQTEGRAAAEQATCEHAQGRAVEAGQVGLERLHDGIIAGRFDVEVIHARVHAQVGRELPIGNVRHDFAAGAYHHIHRRRVGRAV